MNRLSILNRVALTAIGACALFYTGDYLSLRFRIPDRAPLGSVQIRPLLAIPQKNRKTEYVTGEMENQTCTNSLFPQMGYSPCWYVRRHTQPTRNM